MTLAVTCPNYLRPSLFYPQSAKYKHASIHPLSRSLKDIDRPHSSTNTTTLQTNNLRSAIHILQRQNNLTTWPISPPQWQLTSSPTAATTKLTRIPRNRQSTSHHHTIKPSLQNRQSPPHNAQPRFPLQGNTNPKPILVIRQHPPRKHSPQHPLHKRHSTTPLPPSLKSIGWRYCSPIRHPLVQATLQLCSEQHVHGY